MKSLNGRLMDFLSEYTGALNDRLFKFLRAQGLTGALPDMMRKMGVKKLADILGLTLGETRSILNFNGTQWAELSEPVVLDSDFEIEMLVYVGEYVPNQTFISGDDFRFQVIGATDKLVLTYRDVTDTRKDSIFGDLLLINDQINRIKLKRVGTNYTAELNGNTETNEILDIKSFSPSALGKNVSGLGGTDYLIGAVFETKIWTGSGESKQLVTDLRFDQPDTDYQRDYSKPVGANVSAISAAGEFSDTTPYYTLKIDDPVEPGFYLSELTIHRVDYGAVKINLNGTGNDSMFFSAPGVYRLGFHTYDSAFCAIQAGGNGFGGSVSLSLKKWSGAILQNVLPGDWETVTKKEGDDYWLGEENVFSADVVAGFWQVLPGNVYTIDGTQTSNNDITTDSAMTVGGTYIFTGLCENIVGTFAFRAGPNEILLIESDGFFEAELTAEIVDIVLRAQPGSSGTFSKLSVRRKFQYAEGALVEPEVPVEVSQVDLQRNESFENLMASMNNGSVPEGVATVDATTLTLNETSGVEDEGLANCYVTKLTGITEPVYFEMHIDSPSGQAAWGAVEPFFAAGVDFEKFLHYALGDNTASDFGGILVGFIDDETVLYADDEHFLNTFSFAENNPHDYSTEGFYRVGCTYDPVSRQVNIHIFSENGTNLRYYPAQDPESNVEPLTIGPVASPFITTSVQNCADSADDELCVTLLPVRYYYGPWELSLSIVTKAADFEIPGGIPSGYTALDEVTGTATAEYDLGDYFMHL